jgi:hypothetical protein
MSTTSPFEDETFSSWIYRLAVYDNLPTLGVDALNDLFLLSVSQGDFDADFDSACDFSTRCRDLILCSPESYKVFFAPMSQWIIPRYYRRSYCYECFCEQIPQAGHPVVLRGWAVTYHTICAKHKVIFQDADYGVGKHLAVGSKLFGFHNEVLHGRELIMATPEEWNAATSVQHLLLTSEMYMASKKNQYPDYVYSFCRLFLEIMLYPDFGFCSRLYLRAKSRQGDLVFWKRLRLGPYLASAQQRHAAISLLGWVLGLSDSGVKIVSAEHVDTFFDLGQVSNVVGSSDVYSLLQVFGQHIRCRGVGEFIRGYSSKNY